MYSHSNCIDILFYWSLLNAWKRLWPETNSSILLIVSLVQYHNAMTYNLNPPIYNTSDCSAIQEQSDTTRGIELRPSHIWEHFHASCLNKHYHENKLFSLNVLMRTKCSHAMFSWNRNVCRKCSHEIKIYWVENKCGKQIINVLYMSNVFYIYGYIYIYIYII